jgi:hypothetical protein
MMKVSLVALLPAVVLGAVLEIRQSPKENVASNPTAPKFGEFRIASSAVDAQFRAGAKREITRVGPFDLLPGVSCVSLF